MIEDLKKLALQIQEERDYEKKQSLIYKLIKRVLEL